MESRIKYLDFRLSKTYPNEYSKKEIKILGEFCEDQSFADLKSNLDSAISQQLQNDLKHGYYKKSCDEEIYYACPKEDANFVGVVPGMILWLFICEIVHLVLRNFESSTQCQRPFLWKEMVLTRVM